jgi:hypothetical protein
MVGKMAVSCLQDYGDAWRWILEREMMREETEACM